FPRNLLKKICSPAHITHLREKDTWEFLQHIKNFGLTPIDQTHMQNLFTLVECQLGFPLFHEIEWVNVSLGKNESSTFSYKFLDLSVDQDVVSLDYNQSVKPAMEEIMESMMKVFEQSGLTPDDVDQICLTGGTSQFPLIRKQLKDLFGEQKILEHNIY